MQASGVGTLPIGAPAPSPAREGATAQDETEEFLRKLSVEKSKYLGGDEEHTHLVKGLDFALLAKVRSEMGGTKEQKQSKAKAAAASETQKEAVKEVDAGEEGIRSDLARRLHKNLFERQTLQHISGTAWRVYARGSDSPISKTPLLPSSLTSL